MNCEQIISDYLKWIKDNTLVKASGSEKICIVSTPFLDRHNDHVELSIEKVDSGYHLSDQGYTLADLRMSGFELNTPKRETILRTTLNGFGIKMSPDGELFTDASESNLGQKKHYLLQAILAVNDMFNLAQETVYSLFKEDVELYFRTHGVIFTRDVKLTGKSGFDHNIDFLIPAFAQKRERLVKAINTPKKDPILSAIMAFTDVQEQRATGPKSYVIYNDTEKAVAKDVVDAMVNYSITPIAWSTRDEYLSELSFN